MLRKQRLKDRTDRTKDATLLLELVEEKHAATARGTALGVRNKRLEQVRGQPAVEFALDGVEAFVVRGMTMLLL